MARIRVPGGVCTPQQWLALDALADSHANGTLKITTRQAFQFHGILKGNLRPAIKAINAQLMDTLAACGDVNRNVMANPNPEQSALHAETLRLAKAISDHLSPRTRAYHEIWIGDDLVAGGEPDHEPLYGTTYLPRKFKTVIAIPPSNDVDIYAHDLGFIAIADESGKSSSVSTSPSAAASECRTTRSRPTRASPISSASAPSTKSSTSPKVMLVQRDYGDRTDRKHARLKYTIADRGIVWFRAEVEKRLGYFLGSPRRFEFTSTGDRYGWVEGENGNSHYTLFIMSGRIKDALKPALREIATAHTGDFRLYSQPKPHDRRRHARAASRHRSPPQKARPRHRQRRLRPRAQRHVLRRPAHLRPGPRRERALPARARKAREPRSRPPASATTPSALRITGCPNGCGRPDLAEIGFVGTRPRQIQHLPRRRVQRVPVQHLVPSQCPGRRDHPASRTDHPPLRPRAHPRRAFRRFHAPAPAT